MAQVNADKQWNSLTNCIIRNTQYAIRNTLYDIPAGRMGNLFAHAVNSVRLEFVDVAYQAFLDYH